MERGVQLQEEQRGHVKCELSAKIYAYSLLLDLMRFVNAAPVIRPRQKENGPFSMMLVVNP